MMFGIRGGQCEMLVSQISSSQASYCILSLLHMMHSSFYHLIFYRFKLGQFQDRQIYAMLKTNLVPLTFPSYLLALLYSSKKRDSPPTP